MDETVFSIVTRGLVGGSPKKTFQDDSSRCFEGQTLLPILSIHTSEKKLQSHNKCPKQFGKRPHCRLVTPPGCKWIHQILTPV